MLLDILNGLGKYLKLPTCSKWFEKMTVAELKKELEKYPDTMDVFIKQSNDEFEVSLVNEVKKQNVLFSEGNGKPETEAYEDVVIITDF